MRKLIILPFLIVAIAGCKYEVGKTAQVKPKCYIVPLIIDTVLLEPEPLSSEYERGNSGEVWQDQYGCTIYRKLTRNIYFNPITNHSKI